MRLQSQISRKYGDTEYKKSWVVIPSKILKMLKWRTKQKLKAEIKEDKLIIEKDGNKET